jgi:hypothetical protein
MRYYHFESGDEKSLQKLMEAFRMLDGKFTIEVKKQFPIRSIAANKYFRVLVKTLSIETGHDEDEIVNMFKMACHYETVYYPSGKEERVPKKTRDLDTAEFQSMLNKFKQWVRDEFPTVKFKDIRDTTYQDWMDINNRYEQTFSG